MTVVEQIDQGDKVEVVDTRCSTTSHLIGVTCVVALVRRVVRPSCPAACHLSGHSPVRLSAGGDLNELPPRACVCGTSHIDFAVRIDRIPDSEHRVGRRDRRAILDLAL